MKKTLLGMMAFVAMAIVGCSNEPVEQDVPMGESIASFYATVESQENETETRTSLGDENAIVWNAGDAITIFRHNGRIQEFVTANGGTTDVKFDYKDEVANTGNTLSANYAVYPHGVATGFDGGSETFTVDLSNLASQTYTENTFAPGAAVMVSKSTSENLFFKNAMSFVRCQLKGSVPGDYVVTSVKISSASKALSGTATIAMSDCIAVMAADGGKSVEVVAANGIVLENEYTDVYLTIPAGTYTDLTYTITGYKDGVGEDDTPVVFSANFSTTFGRNKIKTLRKTFNSDSWNGSTSEDKIWDGETYTEPNVEDGVMNINTPAEMAWLGTKNGNTLASGVTTVNINGSFDMNGMTFTTLCINKEVTINGNENTISNLTLKAPVVNGNIIGHNGGAGGAAFVNVATGSKVTVKDLTFSGATAIDQEDTANAKAAIVADNVEGVLILNNVHVTNSTVKGIYAMGGLVNDVQCNNLNGTSGDVTITNCSVTKTTFSNIEVANESGCIGSIIGRVAGGHTTIDKTKAEDNVIEAYVCRGNQERTVGDYVGNYVGQVSGSLSSSLVITEGTISNVNIIANNTLAESQQNIYGEFLGGWREEGKGTVSINGTEVVRFINTQAEFAAAVAAGGTVFLSENETGEPYTWVKPSKDVTIVGREGLATTRSARPAYATIKFGGGSLNAGASKIAFEKLNLKFTDTDYSGFHHSAEESYKQCNIYECVWTYAPKATFENCYFYQDNNDYNIWMYGANTNDITVKGCEFVTDNKSILIYAEGARTYDVTVEDCIFTAARTTDKCAIQMHTEWGNLSGTLVMNNNTASGYEATNGGLYKEWVNGAIAGGLPKGTITNYFDKTLNGVNLNQAVINAIKTGGNVTLTEDLPVKETFDIPAGVTTNLDLNGKTIYIRPAADATAAVDINNYGTLNLKGGKIVAKADAAEYARRCIYNRAGGVMTIDGTEFVQVYESKGAAINNAGEMTIENATVTSKYWSIWNEGEGKLTIKGGTFNCNSRVSNADTTHSYAIRNTGDAKLTVNGGTFNCTHGFVSADGGESTINGGVVTATGDLGSRHIFYVEGENAKVTVPSTSTFKAAWNSVAGSTIVYNESGNAENISVVGGLYNVTGSHGKNLYFTASNDATYPYKAITAYEALKLAAAAGEDYTVLENITNAPASIVYKGGVLNGNDFTLHNAVSGSYAGTINMQAGGTIKNMTIKNTKKQDTNPDRITAVVITGINSDILIEDCNLSGNYTSLQVRKESTAYGLTVRNSSFVGAIQLTSKLKFIEFENCTFEKSIGGNPHLLYNTSKFTNCEFKGLVGYFNNGTITFCNCTKNGVLITDANKKSMGFEYVKIDNATKVADNAGLKDALANGDENIKLAAGSYTMPAGSSFTSETVINCEEGTVFEGKSGLDINGATIVGATFNKESYENAVGAVSGTINGTLKECTFTGGNALRYCYAGETVVFEDCVFDGEVYGVHFDAGSNDVIFRNCTLSGFNAFGSAMNVTFENCTFKCTGKSAYNGVNLWGSAKMIGCEFTFDGAAANEWIWCNEEGGYTYEMTNCTIAGEQVTPANYTQFFPKIEESGATVKINGVDCVLTK